MVFIGDVFAVVFAFGAMCLVIYLSYVVSKILAKTSMKMNTAKYLKIVDRIPLGKDRFLIIANVGKKNFLMGVTDRQIEILTELVPEDMQEIEKPQSISGAGLNEFKSILNKAMKKNKPLD